MWDRLADRIASVLADAGAATALLPKQHVNLRELQVSTCEQTATALKAALAGCHRLATLAEVVARMPIGDSTEQNFDEMVADNKARFEEWQRNQCPDPTASLRHARSDRAHAKELASFEGNEPELIDPELAELETNPDRCCGTCRFQGDGGTGRQHLNSCRRCETEGETAGWEPALVPLKTTEVVEAEQAAQAHLEPWQQRVVDERDQVAGWIEAVRTKRPDRGDELARHIDKTTKERAEKLGEFLSTRPDLTGRSLLAQQYEAMENLLSSIHSEIDAEAPLATYLLILNERIKIFAPTAAG